MNYSVYFKPILCVSLSSEKWKNINIYSIKTEKTQDIDKKMIHYRALNNYSVYHYENGKGHQVFLPALNLRIPNITEKI